MRPFVEDPLSKSEPNSSPSFHSSQLVPEELSKQAYIPNENGKKVAKWELDSLASMIAPIEEADNQSIHVSIFAEPMETERSSYSSLNITQVEGQVRNLEIEKLMQSFELESKIDKKQSEEDDLLDMLDA